ncbi:MAG TPA: hypothetical protein VLV81_11460 [Acidimicrobiia bacterium]|nr:hypothetical protein [Acidimicrobiia bacterium]
MWWRRNDGELVRDLARNRRVMPYLMRGRNESAVYFEHDVTLRNTDAFVREWNQANPGLRIDMFHLAVWALKDTLSRNPTTNRFVAGGRLYQRHGIWFSYAIKSKLVTGAPLIVVKRRMDLDESFAAMVLGMHETETRYRTGDAAQVDRELGLLLFFPGFIRRILMRGVDVVDRLGMLPRSYIENDPMYASAFMANMASLGMPPVYHHLYEYGTASIFCSLGRPVPAPGSPTSGPDRRRTMQVRWTFDERAEDGLTAWFAARRFRQVMEDPTACGVAIDAVAPDATQPIGETVDDAARF